MFVKKIFFFRNNKKGFTLIELLVVIAIIGLLATIVMVSLNSARVKAGDVAVKANMKTALTQGEMVYDTSGSYAGVCADATVTKALDAAVAAGGGAKVCNNQTASWAATVPLKSSGYWCVDTTGAQKSEAAALSAGVYACP